MVPSGECLAVGEVLEDVGVFAVTGELGLVGLPPNRFLNTGIFAVSSLIFLKIPSFPSPYGRHTLQESPIWPLSALITRKHLNRCMTHPVLLFVTAAVTHALPRTLPRLCNRSDFHRHHRNQTVFCLSSVGGSRNKPGSLTLNSFMPLLPLYSSNKRDKWPGGHNSPHHSCRKRTTSALPYLNLIVLSWLRQICIEPSRPTRHCHSPGCSSSISCFILVAICW